VPTSQTAGDYTKTTGLPAAAAAALIETALGQLDEQAGWYFLGGRPASYRADARL